MTSSTARSARPDPIRTLVAEIQARRLPSPATCRQIRIEAGAGVEAAARAMGVSAAALMSWEAERRTPRGYNAIRWRELIDALQAAMQE